MRRVSLLLPLLLLISPTIFAGSRITDAVVPECRTSSPISLDVVLSEKRLDVKLGKRIVRSYPVAIGTLQYPTPEGEYVIEELIWNPSWYPPASEWAKGLEPTPPGDPSNPMRVVKIPFDSPYYYIHGTDRPETVGTMASHGCLRMTARDVRELGTYLMRWSGHDAGEAWVRRSLRSRQTETVRLPHPVSITIRMGPENVYPGVVWDLEPEPEPAR